MSSANSSGKSTNSEKLVEQIIEQGQRLRNAMVKSILDNDPFYASVYSSRLTPVRSAKRKKFLDDFACVDRCLTEEEQTKVASYLKGNRMSKSDEERVLECLKSMSALDLCKATTSQTFLALNSCKCDICKAYHNQIDSERRHRAAISEGSSRVNFLLCDTLETEEPFFRDNRKQIQEPTSFPQEIVKSIQQSYRSISAEYLKFVDSLKVSIHNLRLNQTGNRKVALSNMDGKYKLPLSLSHTYFIEYKIPNALTKTDPKYNLKRVDTGLNTHLVRICSKRLQNDAVYFKQTSLHDIIVPDKSLEDIEMVFRVSCRSTKQKNSILLGSATFNLSCFEVTKYLSCTQELQISDSSSPLIIGTLTANVQLGCGKLYFGKEFIDAISSNKVASTIILPRELSDPEEFTVKHPNSPASFRKQQDPIKTTPVVVEKPIQNISESKDTQTVPDDLTPRYRQINVRDFEKRLLFGLVYISEAQYLKEPTASYVKCHPFAQSDLLCSRIVSNTSNPIFDFVQKVPLLYEDNLLSNLQENFMLIEFWERPQPQENLIGVSKIPLHQFYVAFRNPAITEHLVRNKFPVIGADWWEPICFPIDGDVCGQVKLLVALGTETQIANLEIERGLKSRIVTAKSAAILPEHFKAGIAAQSESVSDKNVRFSPKTAPLKKAAPPKKAALPKKVVAPLRVAETFDIGTQSDIEMDKSGEENFGHFLAQLLAQTQRNTCVENSTNTEEVPQQELRDTSNLSDPLENKPNRECFKVRVVVEQALHLPTRKKCKSKKTKRKSFAYEEVSPSTYVTFETLPGKEAEMSNVIDRSASPCWDFVSDVFLPRDLLTCSQKRLIFKVWKKSNNGLRPNKDVDSVLGFAALDLSVLSAGLPTVHGWFNIVDFSSKCNGQIKISVTPLENLNKFPEHQGKTPPPALHGNASSLSFLCPKPRAAAEEPGELLNRALKRKFVELEEITQRLRTRLANVTKDDSDTSNDDFADAFERDINTLCLEEDVNMIDMPGTSKIFDPNLLALKLAEHENNLKLAETASGDASGNSLISFEEAKKDPPNLDQQLIDGKQKIDALLEKLSLIANPGAFSNRYVSGCSLSQLSEDGKQGSSSSSGNNADTGFDSLLNQFCTFDSTSSLLGKTQDTAQVSSSTSISLSDNRAAPDGAGSIVYKNNAVSK